MIKFDCSMAEAVLPEETLNELAASAEYSNRTLGDGSGAGSGFIGWVSLPSSLTESGVDGIIREAERLRAIADVVVVVGIGGSYLGAKAVIEALGDPFACLKRERSGPQVVFAGQNLSGDYLYELMDALREHSVGIIVISKSGTTTEPAVAFRFLRDEMERRYGKEGAGRRIIAVTDNSRGALRKFAVDEGYATFAIPDDVGGRYSVLTPVGLLPLAVAGIDIKSLMAGAREMERSTAPGVAVDRNIAAQYAVARNALYGKGYKIEILGSYEPSLQYLGEWWKQLFGESEGKDGKGIFPASVTLTTDLHSMGQYIQDGERTIFETIISVEGSRHDMRIGIEKGDPDGLNFLAGKRLCEVNRMAEAGVALAHADGGVPNIRIVIPRIDAYNIGALLYFFEKACGISGYMLGVNPFDQPGVEAYKKNMFALLDKPGYEEEGKKLRERLKLRHIK